MPPQTHRFVLMTTLAVLGACSQRAADDLSPTPSVRAQPAGAAPARNAANANATAGADCNGLPGAGDLKRFMKEAARQGNVGGLGEGANEWAAVVDRNGLLCAIAVETDDPAAAWPGSQSIAKAKAFTANAFSSDTAPMSTARLYTMSQPGHSLWGGAAGDPFNPKCMTPPNAPGGIGEYCGGLIVFGGGVPLYKDAKRVGGLGLSGDTPCADHEMAKRVRTLAQLDPAPGSSADDITYSSVDGPSPFTHPLCANTFRNGKKIGDEPPAAGY